MELDCYFIDERGRLEVRPAPLKREWMDAARERAPYRCVPLAVANGFGWELLSPVGFTAIWNGGQDVDGLVVLADEGDEPLAYSHFGEGILTFHIPALFRTDTDTDLMVQGPINRPKDAIAPLTGIVESDWGPFSFTMNWKFTRPKTAVRFKKGEPFCHIFPIRRGSLESVEPRLSHISAKPALQAEHESWLAARIQFIKDLKIPGSDARSQKWQKNYLRGVTPRGDRAPASHRIKSHTKPLKEFGE